MEQIKNIDVKLKYFKEYWISFTTVTKDNINDMNCFANLEQDSINPLSFNPQVLLMEFIDELESIKDLTKSKYKDLFMNNIKKLAEGKFTENKLCLDSLKFLQSNLKLIQKYFSPQKKGCYSSLLYSLKFILMELKNFKLGIECIRELADILTDESELECNKEKIKALVNFIVFEFRNKKYADTSIQKIIDFIFTPYQVFSSNKYIDIKFPHNIKRQKDEEEQGYYQRVKKYIDSLSIKEVILALQTYFKKKPMEVTFIFQMKGISCDESFENIKGIQIYNPLYKQLINKKEDEYIRIKELSNNFIEESSFVEALNKIKSTRLPICNIAIQIDMIDFEYSANEAIRKVENCFNMLISRNFSLKCELNILTNFFMVINKNGEEIGLKKKFNNIDYINNYDLKDFQFPKEYLEYYSTLINEPNLDKLDKKILESANSKRKGLEANNYNETILWHWISIENLFEIDKDNTNNILNFAPQILAIKYIHNFIQQIGLAMHSKIFSIFSFYDDDISKNAKFFIKETQSQVLSYKEFIEKIGELLKILEQSENDKKTFFYEKLKSFREIVTDDKKFIKFVINYQQQIKQKILFLYRIRNKIVHNANIEQNSMAIYYKNFAGYMNTILLCYFIDKRLKGMRDNKEIFYSGEYELQKIKENGLKVVLQNE